MKNRSHPSGTVYGITAPAPRPTKTAAALIAFAVALPVGVILWIVEWAFL